jgi:molybdopterin converting factor small subunit
MIRVVLPAHLRALAGIRGEVRLDVAATDGAAVTIGQALDALEASYPALRGAIRRHGGGQRRPLVRFFACQQDLSHEPQYVALPGPVQTGDEPLLIVGAMAGG